MVFGLMPGAIGDVTDETFLLFAEGAGATFPVMFDADGTYYTYDAVGASAPFPLDVLVDKNGVVRRVSTRYDPDTMEELVRELVEE